MSAPTSDRDGITQALQALDAAGHRPLRVDGGDGPEDVSTVHEAIEAVLEFDDAFVVVSKGDGESWVRFVMGNDPDEVVCDYLMSLEPVLGPLTESWWDR